MIYFGQLLLKSQRLKETFITTCLEGVPSLFLGSQLRSWLYQLILNKVSRSTYIQEGVELLGCHSISLGNSVSLFKGVRVDARGLGNAVVLDDNTSLQRGVDIRALNQTRIHVGNYSFIGPYTCLAGPGDIEIGNHCSIASHCGIFANDHKFDDPTRGPNDQGLTRQGIVIEQECWIGHGVSILDGVRVGKGSVVGAGSVILRDIPPMSVAVGIPARVIKKRGN